MNTDKVASARVPVRPTFDERLRNAVADLAIERFIVTAEEQERVHAALAVDGRSTMARRSATANKTTGTLPKPRGPRLS